MDDTMQRLAEQLEAVRSAHAEWQRLWDRSQEAQSQEFQARGAWEGATEALRALLHDEHRIPSGYSWLP